MDTRGYSNAGEQGRWWYKVIRKLTAPMGVTSDNQKSLQTRNISLHALPESTANTNVLSSFIDILSNRSGYDGRFESIVRLSFENIRLLFFFYRRLSLVVENRWRGHYFILKYLFRAEVKKRKIIKDSFQANLIPSYVRNVLFQMEKKKERERERNFERWNV